MGTLQTQESMIAPALFNSMILLLTLQQTMLMVIPSFYSFFYGATMGTYLSLHFSVRARALSSLLVRKYLH